MDLLIKFETLISMQAKSAATLPLAEQQGSMLDACCSPAWQSEALCEHSLSTHHCTLVLRASLLPTIGQVCTTLLMFCRRLCCPLQIVEPLIEGEAFIGMLVHTTASRAVAR